MSTRFLWLVLVVLMWISLALIPVGIVIAILYYEQGPYFFIPISAIILSIASITVVIDVRHDHL